MPTVSNDIHDKNQLASDWMHRGIDLLSEDSLVALERAVRCFDEAIALRSTLPLGETPFYRYGLSAGWINRGDALARLGGRARLTRAVMSYDEALKLLESLPLAENVLYSRRLAITWINRGMALQNEDAPCDMRQASECFRAAIAALESPWAQEIADRPSLLAGAWSNLAGSIPEDREGARAAAGKALSLVRSCERTDLLSAEVGLKTRHLLCRVAVKDLAGHHELFLSEATTAVDEAMALARHWTFRDRADLDRLAQEIFRFGCLIYEKHQPQLLPRFLAECLAPELFGKTICPGRETLDAAEAALWSILTKLQPDGFQFLATPQRAPFLAGIHELKMLEDRIKQLRVVESR